MGKYVSLGDAKTPIKKRKARLKGHWDIVVGKASKLLLTRNQCAEAVASGGKPITQANLAIFGRRMKVMESLFSHLDGMRAKWVELDPVTPPPPLENEQWFRDGMAQLQRFLKENLDRMGHEAVKRATDRADKAVKKAASRAKVEKDGEDDQESEEEAESGDEDSEHESDKAELSENDSSYSDFEFDDYLSPEDPSSHSDPPTESDPEREPPRKKKLTKTKRTTSKLKRSKSVKTKTPPKVKAYRPEFNYKLYKMLMESGFHGFIKDWPEFSRMFKTAIHNTDLTVDFKFSTLKKLMKDKELYLKISSYSASSYKEAWKYLESCFEGVWKVMDSVLRQVQEMPKSSRSSDVKTFGRVVNCLLGIEATLKSSKIDSAYELQIMREVGPKLPGWLVKKYMGTVKKGKIPSISGLLELLKKTEECEKNSNTFFATSITGGGTGEDEFKPYNGVRRNKDRRSNKPKYRQNYETVYNVVQPSTSGRPPIKKKPQSFKGATFTPTNGKNPGRVPQCHADRLRLKPCMNCNLANHFFFQCPEISKAERKRIAMEKGLCLLCLQSGHRVRECDSSYICVKCKAKHNVVFCEAPATYWTKEKTKPQANMVNAEPSPSQTAQEEPSDDEDPYQNCLKHLFVRSVDQKRKGGEIQNFHEFVTIKFEVKGEQFAGILDTGANVNLFPDSFVRKLGWKLTPCDRLLGTPQGEFEVTQETEVQVKIGSIESPVEFLVYPHQKQIILGLPIIKKFKLNVQYDSTVVQVNDDNEGTTPIMSPRNDYVHSLKKTLTNLEFAGQVKALLESYKDSFIEFNSLIGLITSEQCHIRLSSEMPIWVRPYNCTTADQEIIDENIASMLDAGWIIISTSPFSFPVVLADKKSDGKKSRFCINYIRLNAVTIIECFSMPLIDDIKDKFLDAEVFSTIDIASGFHHIEVAPEDRQKTAFSTQNGHYEWMRMPFGLKNAPTIFQRTVSNLILKHGLQKFAVNYIDDIMIFSRSKEEHLEHLEKVLGMVQRENIRLKLKKCQFGLQSVVYLGFQISKNSISPLTSNTAAIEQATAPTNLTSLRGFLGSVNFYRKFIPNRNKLLAPLHGLLKKGTAWEWTEEREEAFQAVKKILVTHPVLRIFDPNNRTIVVTDASHQGLGAVMKQVDRFDPSGAMYVVAYYSKPLLDYQRGYSASEIELLAIISAVEYWHYQLVGIPFTVITDHLPLKSFQKFDKPNTRLHNWALKLGQYNLTIEYQSGDKNVEADYLSRHPIEYLQEVTNSKVLWVFMTRVHQERRTLGEEIMAEADYRGEDRVLWVAAEIVREAQEAVDAAELPKRVRRVVRQGEQKLVYLRKDQEKDYLPVTLATKVLLELHKDKGHIGTKQMELHYCRKYFTPGLSDLAKKIKVECRVCQKAKQSGYRFGTLGQISPAHEPFDIVYIDSKGGWGGYGSVQKEAHFAIDSLTRFAYFMPSKTKEANDFINLMNLILAVAQPKLVVADNYPGIKSEKFRKFLNDREITIIFIAPNHSSSNGLVERLNQTIMERVRCAWVENPRISWPTMAKKVIRQYNDTIHSVTGYTPNFLLTGKDDAKLFAGESIREARMIAFERSEKAHQTSANYFDEGRKDPDFQEGDEVMVRAKHRLNRKTLEPPFEGPYEIKAKVGNTSYELDRNGRTERYHVSQLKPTKVPSYLPNPRAFLLFNLALMLIGAVTRCEASEPKDDERLGYGGPLLWHRTEHIPVVGFNFSTHLAVLTNPCFPLMALYKRNRNPEVNEDFLACNDYFTSRVLPIVEKNCAIETEIKALSFQDRHEGKIHRKRFIPILWAIGGGLVSVGVLTIKHLFLDSEPSKDIAKIDEQLKQNLALIRTENNKTIEFQKLVANILKEQSMRISEVKKVLAEDVEAARIFTVIMTAMSRMELHLQYLLNGFHLGEVREDYNILFPGSPFANGGTPLRCWRAHKCSVTGTLKDQLIMRFEIPKIATTIQILKADPFRLLTKNKDGQECQKRYKGDLYVLYDKANNCSRDLLSVPQTARDQILVDDSHHVCNDILNRSSTWETIHCGDYSKVTRLTQVKQDYEFFYAYCYKGQLKLQGNDYFECENVVYKFSRKIGFSIDGMRWEVTQATYQEDIDVHSNVSALLNRRMFHPQVGLDPAYRKMESIILEEQSLNALIDWKEVSESPFTWGTIIGVCVLIFTVIILVCVIKKYLTRSRINEMQNWVSEMRFTQLRDRERRHDQEANANLRQTPVERRRNQR